MRLVVCLITLSGLFLPATARCVMEENCAFPDCLCSQKVPPGGLDRRAVPQIVLFTFDDAVRSQELAYYNKLFSPDRLNPNGCPIQMTLFLQDKNTDYGAVRDLYKRGMEIAAHSVSHKSPQSAWKSMSADELRKEIYGQKMNIHRKAGIPLENIRGWRSPFLQPTGNTQFDILSEKTLGFSYDSSLASEKRALSDSSSWPFTLDHGISSHCGTPPCPTKNYPGLWEFLITPMIDNEHFPRIYVDSYRPENSSRSYKYLMQNFKSYYHGNRAPFMVNMHAAWFFYSHNLDGMDMFIKALLNYDDVYILPIQLAIEWLRTPVVLNSVKQFRPWRCDNNGQRVLDPLTTAPASEVITAAPTTPPRPPPTRPRPLCRQGVNCRLPSCRCSDGGIPGHLASNAIPQMVLFIFEGPVNDHNFQALETLFPPIRKHPNGMPVSVTLFVSDQGTDYDLVRRLYGRGMEIAACPSVQSASRGFWRDVSEGSLQREVDRQRGKLNLLAGIPYSDIQGWRSLFLQQSGDRQFRILKANGFKYDSSVSVARVSLVDQVDWPFTLDFGWDAACSVPPCPAGRYPGLWVLPMVSTLDPHSGLSCRYVDSCLPENKSAALDYLWKNLESHYTNNRAPFVLNMHGSWFQMNHEQFEAMDEFITGITELSDVFIVTVQQALQWIKRPTALSSMASSSIWPESSPSSFPRAALEPQSDFKKNGTSTAETGNDTSIDDSTDWVIVVLIVVVSIFCACMVLTAAMYIFRKRQMQKRASSIREAITATSERNSVTDWLNTFPRRLSQLSCSNADSYCHSQVFEFNNSNFEDKEKESMNGPAAKTELAHSDSLTLNPKLLETNYSRDQQIWNRQERKIPHILNKSQSKISSNRKGLPVEVIEKHASKKLSSDAKKPWAFVWDPCKNQSHSESVFKTNLKKRSRSTPSLYGSETVSFDPAVNPHRRHDAPHTGRRRSGSYDPSTSDSGSEAAYTDIDGYSHNSDKVVRRRPDMHSSEVSKRVTSGSREASSKTLEKDVKARRSTTLSRREDHTYKRNRASPPSEERHSPKRVSRHKSVFDSHPRFYHTQGADDRLRKSRAIRKDVHRDLSMKSERITRDNEKDPRITAEIEAEWERELRKQLDKFLKSKRTLKGLNYYQ